MPNPIAVAAEAFAKAAAAGPSSSSKPPPDQLAVTFIATSADPAAYAHGFYATGMQQVDFPAPTLQWVPLSRGDGAVVAMLAVSIAFE